MFWAIKDAKESQQNILLKQEKDMPILNTGRIRCDK